MATHSTMNEKLTALQEELGNRAWYFVQKESLNDWICGGVKFVMQPNTKGGII